MGEKQDCKNQFEQEKLAITRNISRWKEKKAAGTKRGGKKWS